MTVKRLAEIGVVAFLFVSFGSLPAEAVSYGGSATGAKVTVPATGTVIRAATNTMPISGGGSEASLLVGDIPGGATGGVVSLAAGVMHSVIVGLDAARAEASMANIDLTVSSNRITSDFFMARGTASCGPGVSGDSQLVNLVINGQSIGVTGNPNQTVTLPNGTVTINQQSSSIAGTTAHITVSALHVITTDPVTHQQLADVVLADVDPQIDCSGGPPPSKEFGTGGGWVTSNDLFSHATFGVVGGTQPSGSTVAHVVYDDHGSTDYHLRSIFINSVTHGTCETTIDGQAETSYGTDKHFVLTITDNSDPGSSVPQDTFRLEVGDAYAGNINPYLEGGNIQEHNASCP